jgi:hypothetical protein
MAPTDYALWLLAEEARAMLTRLDRVRPLVLEAPMVPAAALTFDAQTAVERFLFEGRRALRAQLLRYLDWLLAERRLPLLPLRAQRRFMWLKLRFNAVLTHFDLFTEAVNQRSQSGTGVWLAGLDVAARDALTIPGWLEPPPLVCFLARDPGGAIRRRGGRLPAGGKNPVALIRLPRERMIGCGIASSLAHEAGHQAGELLGLMAVARPALLAVGAELGYLERQAWQAWMSWLSEILADAWAVGCVGVSSTLGLISLVSLPAAFVFRLNDQDPHPTPWLRVQFSCALGAALYPHPCWQRLATAWAAFYPPSELPMAAQSVLMRQQRQIPRLVATLLELRVPCLDGVALERVLCRPALVPARLTELAQISRHSPSSLRQVSPTVAFAALGLAREAGQISAEREGSYLAALLDHWALKSTLSRARRCAWLPGSARPKRLALDSAWTMTARLRADISQIGE